MQSLRWHHASCQATPAALQAGQTTPAKKRRVSKCSLVGWLQPWKCRGSRASRALRAASSYGAMAARMNAAGHNCCVSAAWLLMLLVIVRVQEFKTHKLDSWSAGIFAAGGRMAPALRRKLPR